MSIEHTQAKQEAFRRIRKLKDARRKEIVDAIGERLSNVVDILGNGTLWVRGGGYSKEIWNEAIKGLNKAGVNIHAQWTQLPKIKYTKSYPDGKVTPILPTDEEWNNTGRKLKG